jgi:hypothetical protein
VIWVSLRQPGIAAAPGTLPAAETAASRAIADGP